MTIVRIIVRKIFISRLVYETRRSVAIVTATTIKLINTLVPKNADTSESKKLLMEDSDLCQICGHVLTIKEETARRIDPSGEW